MVEPDEPQLEDYPSFRDDSVIESPSFCRKTSLEKFSSAPSQLTNGVLTLDKVNLGEFIGLRFRLGKILASYAFNVKMGLVVLAHTGLIVIETDAHADCASSPDRDQSECDSDILLIINTIFLVVYTVELLTRFYVLRLRTLASPLNCLDLFIVLIGFLDLILTLFTSGVPGPSLSVLRMVRAVRLLRVVRVFQRIPELHAIMRGFLSAMKSMFWGFMLISAFLLFFSILTVELVHPISVRIHQDDVHCKEAFSSVWYSLNQFFQILVVGGEYGRCLIPIIHDQWWTFIMFTSAVICVQLGFMNLILAVIVDRAARAKEDDEEEGKRERKRAFQKATNKLTKICGSIDTDGSGTLSLDELLCGFDDHPELETVFARLDMTKSDVEELFTLMDVERNGELSYQYFIDNIRTCQLDDPRKSMTMLRLQCHEISRHCTKLTGELCANMSRQQSPQSPSSHGTGRTTPRQQLKFVASREHALRERAISNASETSVGSKDLANGTVPHSIEEEKIAASNEFSQPQFPPLNDLEKAILNQVVADQYPCMSDRIPPLNHLQESFLRSVGSEQLQDACPLDSDCLMISATIDGELTDIRNRLGKLVCELHGSPLETDQTMSLSESIQIIEDRATRSLSESINGHACKSNLGKPALHTLSRSTNSSSSRIKAMVGDASSNIGLGPRAGEVSI